MSFSQEEIEEFKAEALDLLDTAEKSLLALDGGADFRPMFDAIFRSFHNLKGASGMMELNLLQAHTHELENVLMKYKETTSIPKEVISFFLQGVDVAKSILNGEQVEFNHNLANSFIEEKPVAQEKMKADLSPTAIIEDVSGLGSVNEFVAECEEILERFSKNLQLLENNFGKENSSKETIDALYRDVHSLKGSAYLFSFKVLGDLGHAMESALEGVREGTHTPIRQLFDVLFNSLTVIERILTDIKSKSSDDGYATLVGKASHALATVASRLPEAPKPEPKLEVAPETPAPVAMAEELPSFQIEEEPMPTQHLAGVHQSESAPQKIESSTPKATAVAEHGGTSHSSAPSAKEKEAEGATSIRVPVNLLDSLMTLMGEMVLVRNQVLQYSNKSEDLEFLNMSKRLNVVTTEIQGEMMKTRMQPIGNVLSKFNRVVRDLSNELGKNIHLNLSGSEIELDKSLLESVKDPLTHIVRNSCDHGIETPDVRAQAGKPSTGTIDIKAYHEGGQVVIDIADDGKGLNKEILIRKAIEKGILPQAEVNTISDKEAFNLIFAPGFSTAAKVTNVSGRGVGMDVVRTNIERIGGTVELSSVTGKGTTIKIKIPLTLAIVPALIVKNNGETFAIPQVKLEELLRVDGSTSEDKIEILHNTPVYRLRGKILPLVDLNHILQVESEPTSYRDRVTNIAVLSAEHCSFGLIIDEIQDTADIVVKPLNRLLKSLQIYSGATILGDGSVALILDVLGISKVAEIKHGKVQEIDKFDDEAKTISEIQDFLLIQVKSPTKHCFALGYVNRLEEFRRKDIEFSGRQRVVRYRNMILPILSANEILGYGPSECDGDMISVVVVLRGGTLYGIEVDGIIDTLSTTVDSEPSMIRHPGIFGSLNTKDELIVIVDPFELITLAFPDLVHHTSKIQKKNFSGEAASCRILLVEDTVFFRRAIAAALEKSGHKITMANDGQEALKILNESPERFDLIVSDIEMPRMNGFQLAQNIRKHPSYGKIPMLAVSSRADKNYTDEGLRAGFNLYLEKLKTEDLLNAVRSLTQKEEVAA